MIKVFNLYKSYGGVSPVLSNISFEVKDGEFVFLTGASGAGKTTLFKVLFGWEKFNSGQILVGGINVGKLNQKNLYLLRRKIGIIFQDYKLLSRKSVFENVAFTLEIIGADAKTIRAKTWEALKNVGLVKKKDSYPSQLSGGEQQRVSIARAMVNDPELILADEPTGNLDSEISKEILSLFEKMNQQGKTVILATHSSEILREKQYRRLSLKQGKLLQLKKNDFISK
jgi:cell division transport system ATP-binding protein